MKEQQRKCRASLPPRDHKIEREHRTFDVPHISNEYFYLKPLVQEDDPELEQAVKASLESAKCVQDGTTPRQDLSQSSELDESNPLRETENGKAASNSVTIPQWSHPQQVATSDYNSGSSHAKPDSSPLSPHTQGIPYSQHGKLIHQRNHLEQSPTNSPPPVRSDARINMQSGFSSDEEATGQKNDSQQQTEIESSEVETGSRSTLSSRPPPSVSRGTSNTGYPASTSTAASSHGYERSLTIDHRTPGATQSDTLPPHIDRSQSQPANSAESKVRPPMRKVQSEPQTVRSDVFTAKIKLSDAPGSYLLSTLNGLRRIPDKYTHFAISVHHNHHIIVEPSTDIEISEPDEMKQSMYWFFQGLDLEHCTGDDPILTVKISAIRYSPT